MKISAPRANSPDARQESEKLPSALPAKDDGTWSSAVRNRPNITLEPLFMDAHDVVEDQLTEIRGLLNRLGTLRLGPVLSPIDVGAFERRHGVQLPVGFRRFVLEVGNGGDGPGCGLTAFEPHSQQPRIAHPFPLEQVWVLDDDEAPDQDRIAACRDGWLPIGSEGCDMDWVLIVSGTQRGKVWNMEGQGAQPCAPSLDFLDWYLAWLRWTVGGALRSGIEWWDVVWAEYTQGGSRPSR